MTDNSIVPKIGGENPHSDAADPAYVLRLYVTGQTPRSVLAIDNMRKICAEHLSERYTLEVIDIYLNPGACQEQQIIAAPTLIKVLPHPLRRIIGDLSNTEKVLVGLDLRPRSGPPEQKDG
jgi:circadian clock protein KaiB